MRSTLAVLVLTAWAPLAAQQPANLDFLKPKTESAQDALRAYENQPYQAIRPGEVRSAAFLTEGAVMPYGQLLGPVSPATVPARESAELANLGATIGVRAPAGASYQKGDTVVLAERMPALKGWGEIVVPTGLARIGDSNPRQTEAVVIAVYGPIRGGQVTLPFTPVPKSGSAQPVPADGPTGNYLMGRTGGELHQPGSELFVDLGQQAGIRVGDFIAFRRRPGPRINAADMIPETLAVGQVVHVGDKSSTVRLFRVMEPSIPAGTPVVRTATLPN